MATTTALEVKPITPAVGAVDEWGGSAGPRLSDRRGDCIRRCSSTVPCSSVTRSFPASETLEFMARFGTPCMDPFAAIERAGATRSDGHRHDHQADRPCDRGVAHRLITRSCSGELHLVAARRTPARGWRHLLGEHVRGVRRAVASRCAPCSTGSARCIRRTRCCRSWREPTTAASTKECATSIRWFECTPRPGARRCSSTSCGPRASSNLEPDGERQPAGDFSSSTSSRRSSPCGGSWRLGDIVLWDNRAFQHYAVNDYEGTRVLQKSLVAGDRPYGPR